MFLQTPSNLTLPCVSISVLILQAYPLFLLHMWPICRLQKNTRIVSRNLNSASPICNINKEAGRTEIICHTNSASKYSGILSQLENMVSRPVKQAKNLCKAVWLCLKKGCHSTPWLSIASCRLPVVTCFDSFRLLKFYVTQKDGIWNPNWLCWKLLQTFGFHVLAVSH